MTDNNLKRIKKNFFEYYYKFFKYDTRYSLIILRDTKIIFAFQLFFNEWIIEKKVTQQISLKEFDDTIDDYVNKLKNLFGESLDTDIKIDESKIDKIDFEILKKIWDEYYYVYELKANISEYTIFDDMLIELNNAISHLLQIVIKDEESSNFNRAISHIYRATLDGYKDIIKENSIFLYFNESLRNEYYDVREKESEIIGEKSIDKKIEVINDYKKIALNILEVKNLME